MPRATWNDRILARSDTVERVEGDLYFPRRDVDMSVLEESATPYTCPRKGEAQYYHLRIGDEIVEDAAWSYPDPSPAARGIAGHLAFDTERGIDVA